MGCKSRQPANTFGFLRFRRTIGVSISDMPVTEFCKKFFTPAIPDISALATSLTEIDITVLIDDDYQATVSLQYSTDSVNWIDLADLTPISGEAVYNHDNLSEDTDYYYRARSVVGDRSSEWSDVINVKTFSNMIWDVDNSNMIWDVDNSNMIWPL